MNEPASPRMDRTIAVAVATALFAVYAAGACRTIYVGDSGELVTAVHVLGIPHPSGYPLYVLLGKLWTILVPVGSIAFRMSLFSAACAAAACALLFVTIRQDGGSRVAGLFAAGLLAFGPSFWHEANIQRVYALNALFVVLALNRAFAWCRDRHDRDLVLAMLICGLGATNHTVMVLVGLAVAIWVPVVDLSLFRRPKIVLACGVAFVAGLLPYLYLPIRSRMNPVLNWGEPATAKAFLDVVLRRDFWHKSWWESPADVAPVLGDFLSSLGPETGFAGIALVIAVLVVRPDRKWMFPVVTIALTVAVVARHGSYYDIFIWHRYYLPAYLMTIFLAAAGLEAVSRRVPPGVAALILAVPAAMLLLGWSNNDRSRYSFAEDYSRNVLEALPPGAKLVANDDNVLFALLYLKHVERLRPDIELIAEGVKQTKQGMFFDPDVDEVFFTHPSGWSGEGLGFAPRGLVLQAVRAGRPSLPPLVFRPPGGLENRSIPRDFMTRALLSHYWFMNALTWEHRDWPRAWVAIEKGLETAPDYPLSLYNFGLLLERNGFLDEALTAFETAHEINPRGLEGRTSSGSGPPPRILVSGRISAARAERDRIRSLESDLQQQIPPVIAPRSRAWHEAMAALLAEEGELTASRAHALRAGPIER